MPDNHWLRDFSLFHLHSTPPLGGGSCRSIAMPFGAEKLEWRGYPTVKKIWRYLYSFWHNARTWHTHTDTAWRHRPRLRITSRGKKCDVFWDTVYIHILYHLPDKARQRSKIAIFHTQLYITWVQSPGKKVTNIFAVFSQPTHMARLQYCAKIYCRQIIIIIKRILLQCH